MKCPNLISYLSRYRHTKGFGVHSPFAFRFITETLCNRKEAYYLYPALEYNGHGDDRILKLILRVLCALKPKSVGLLPNAQPRVRDIIKEVNKDIVLNMKDPDMFIISPAYKNDSRHLIMECLDRGGSVLWCEISQETIDIIRAMKHGMTFSNGHTLIAVGRRDLPRQHFSLFF